jgi:hypothetical protein
MADKLQWYSLIPSFINSNQMMQISKILILSPSMMKIGLSSLQHLAALAIIINLEYLLDELLGLESSIPTSDVRWKLSRRAHHPKRKSNRRIAISVDNQTYTKISSLKY